MQSVRRGYQRRDGATGKNWTGSTELDRPKSKKGKGCSPLAGREKLQSACQKEQGSVRRTEEVAVRMPDGSSPPDETGPLATVQNNYYHQSSQLLVRPPGRSRDQILACSTLGWGISSSLSNSDGDKLVGLSYNRAFPVGVT